MEVSTRQARARRRRRGLRDDAQALASAELAAHLWGLPEMQLARVVAAFIADDGEVSLWPVVARLWADDATVTVPAIDEADRLIFVRWDRGAELAPGRFGIPVPLRPEPVDVLDHDVILLSGVLFGPDGARAGRGRGYYDRALACRGAPGAPLPPDGPLLVGVGHLCQWDPELRRRPQDAATDVFVSPAGVRRFSPAPAPWN